MDLLPIMEEFYTIQGEGANSGVASYFIRLGGCDVGCVWCDVKESWDASVHPQKTISEIIQEVVKYPGDLVVITGGEPAMYNLTDLTDELRKVGKTIAIETSGVYPLIGSFDWVCWSPKKFKESDDSVASKAHELKVVIYNKHDFSWAEEQAAKVGSHCRLFLQPEWSKEDKMLPLVIDYVKNNPQWRISLQTHKYMNIP